MLGTKTTLTREQLYERVWSTPMQKLAAEFGFSDVGLAKLCGRHEIPVPPRGHWARLQSGQTIARTALKPATHARLGNVEIYTHERRSLEQLTQATEKPTIVVANDGPVSHPLALRIEKCICRSKTSEWGLLLPRQGKMVPVQVSAECLPRALRIYDALFPALERAGHSLAWPKPYDGPVTATVLEEPLKFLITEIVERKEHKLTGDEKAHQKRDSWWRPPRWDSRLTGRLKLSIEVTDGFGIRHSWSDCMMHRVEDCLGQFVVSLTAIAKAIKRQREEWAEQKRKREEERKRQAEQAARRAEYERRAKAIEGLARSWDQSKSIRAFAQRLSSEAEQPSVPEEQKQDLRAMAEWVMRHAQFVDPFTDLAWMIRQYKDPPWTYGG